MNPKITGIILLVVGLGVGLYFINSGGAGKISEILKPPGASTTISGVASTSSPAQGSSQTSSSGFSWASFFSSLFAVHTFPNIPTVTGGSDAYNSGGQTQSGSNGGGNGGATGGSATSTGTSSTTSQFSPYYHDVRFSGVSSGEISLTTYSTYGAATSTVDITGWEIKTNHGGEFIPQVVDIYNPESANLGSDIILTTGSNQPDYVNIFSTSAPANLRVNECMGYLNTPVQFNPGFSYDCPAPDRSQISQFTGACQNYIESLSNCQVPDFSNYYFPRNDYQCEDYLTGKYNYNWCVDTYASQPGFLGDEWRIWMGATPLDSYHDNVELLDRNGLVVDTYSY